MLQEIMKTLQTLSHQVSSLSTPSSSSSQSPSSSADTPIVSTAPAPSPSPVSQPSPPHKEPFVPPPEPYSGETGTASGFILRCSLVFDQQPSRYPTDRSRIAYTINLLRGRAAKWATAVWEQQSPILESFSSFSRELCRVFDHPLQGQEASKRLFSLFPGARSVAEFSIDFRIAASESGWGELELRGMFLRSLSSELKDELATRDEPDSLESLITLAIRIDDLGREGEKRNRLRASDSVGWRPL